MRDQVTHDIWPPAGQFRVKAACVPEGVDVVDALVFGGEERDQLQQDDADAVHVTLWGRPRTGR